MSYCSIPANLGLFTPDQRARNACHHGGKSKIGIAKFVRLYTHGSAGDHQ
jgi:hypothetical protein